MTQGQLRSRWVKEGGENKTNSEWDRLRKIQCLAIASQKRIRVDGLAWSLYGVFPGLLGQCIPVTYPRWTAGRQPKALSDHVTRKTSVTHNNEMWRDFFFLEKKNNALSKKIIHVDNTWCPPFACLSMLPAFTGTARYGPLWSGGLWNDLKLELHHPASSSQLYSAKFISK